MLTMLPKDIHDTLFNLVKPTISFSNSNTQQVHIITLEGSHGVGKDLYAKVLKAMNDYSFIIRFSDPVREDFRLAGYSGEFLDQLKRSSMKFKQGATIGGYDVSDMSAREALIHIAETNKKVHGQYYYANWLVMDANARIRTIRKQYEDSKELLGDNFMPQVNVIIPDLRFDPEVETLQELELNGIQIDGEILKVKRTNIFVGYNKPSETGYDLYLPPLIVMEA